MPRQRLIAAAGLIGALWLGGCTDGYGYSGVSLGYGGGYDGAYGYDGGYGYAPSYYGWYGDYYYPGTGIYVYDRYRRPYRWSADQRRYWRGRPGWRDDRGPGHWRDFDRAGDGRPGWTPGQARPDRGGWRRQAETGRPQAQPNAARDMPPRPGFVPGQRPPEAGGVAPRRGFGQDGRGARRGQERE